MTEQDFIKAGFKVHPTAGEENPLLRFLHENYPGILRDTELNLPALQAALGLPIDEKVNGYGLNFVGRNIARAKYAQETTKALRLNTALSQQPDTTQNLLLKGDNLDSLKLLKHYYAGKIKCIYIDPPYNTDKDEFVYPDRFDREEAEVLGMAHLSDSDYERLEFSFKSKKSHNGWLTFMYPRLLLARDLLRKDGVIFISIDDNEIAQLRLLMDEIFGEENSLTKAPTTLIWQQAGTTAGHFAKAHEYIICYAKNKEHLPFFALEDYGEQKTISHGALKRISSANPASEIFFPKGSIAFDGVDADFEGEIGNSEKQIITGKLSFRNSLLAEDVTIKAGWGMKNQVISWLNGEETFDSKDQKIVRFFFNSSGILWYEKERGTIHPKTVLNKEIVSTKTGSKEVKALLGGNYFDNPKPLSLLEYLLSFSTSKDDIILDFFAGSGTTGDAVMQLNAEDGGSRKFILCQIDEPIAPEKPAYPFCMDNHLPPVISSITIERLRRAGEKIAREAEAAEKPLPDTGFKVFDTVAAPQLAVDAAAQISLQNTGETDALSRIYNMIFKAGVDAPSQAPEVIIPDCMYRIGAHTYITNSGRLTADDYTGALRNGPVFIDAWTASLHGTLLNYKDAIKLLF